MEGAEQRVHNSEIRVITNEADGKKYLEGYGIVFNSESRLLYGFFVERVLPEAVVGADMTEIISKYNHDINRTLGTTWAGTLTYTIDDRGVKYRVELPNNEDGRTVAELAQRGDLRGSSFEFRVKEDKWYTETRNGVQIDRRDIVKFEWIGDLSPVIREAYPGTHGLDVQKRSYEEMRNKAYVPTIPEKPSEEELMLKCILGV